MDPRRSSDGIGVFVRVAVLNWASSTSAVLFSWTWPARAWAVFEHQGAGVRVGAGGQIVRVRMAPLPRVACRSRCLASRLWRPPGDPKPRFR